MEERRSSYGAASWFLVILLFISILLTISFGAQNIRLRMRIQNMESQVSQDGDQTTDDDSLQSQLDTLKKQNDDLTKEIQELKKSSSSSRRK